MIIGVAPTAAFALMIAPRKLQSLAAPVHAEAPATSSVRSTFKFVAKYGFAGAAANFRGATREEPPELENAVCVNFREAPAKITSTNTDNVRFPFIDLSPLFLAV